MQITRPEPEPRDSGDYLTYVSAIAYGLPYAKIYLDEDKNLSLADITLDDARRLAKAAARIEQELAAAHARMTAPHGSEHFYKGRCQLCGKPEADELHAEPVTVADAARTEPDICVSVHLAPGVDYYCSLDAGHAGLHSQLTSAGAFIAEWGYPDGHVHTTSGHKPAAVAS